MVVSGATLAVHQYEPAGRPGSMARARSMAPAGLSAPAPCARSPDSIPDASRSRSEEYCRMAFTAFGVSAGPSGCALLLASSTSATAPLTTAAAMLVPLNRR